MGTCCAAHLAAKVRDYARNAENGAVTVTVIEDLIRQSTQPKCDYVIGMAPQYTAVYCTASAEFALSYFGKKDPDNDPTKPDLSLVKTLKERK